MSHDGEDYTQIAFLRSDIDDSTGEYTERFEAGSFDMPAADALRFDLAVDIMDYFSGRTFEGEPGVSRRGEPGSPGRWPAAPTRGIIDAVGKAPSVSEGAFLHL